MARSPLNFLKWICGFLCSVAWLSAANAGLITQSINVGPLNPGDKKIYNIIDPVGPFADSFNFSLVDNNSDAFGIVIEFSATSSFDISNLALQLFEGFDASGALLAVGAPSPTDLEFQMLGMNAADYSVLVSGDAVGAAGGAYTNILAISTVPEPSTISLAMAGLLSLYGASRVGRSGRRFGLGDFA